MHTWPNPKHRWQAAKNPEDGESARPNRTSRHALGGSEFSIKPLWPLLQGPVRRPDCFFHERDAVAVPKLNCPCLCLSRPRPRPRPQPWRVHPTSQPMETPLASFVPETSMARRASEAPRPTAISRSVGPLRRSAWRQIETLTRLYGQRATASKMRGRRSARLASCQPCF